MPRNSEVAPLAAPVRTAIPMGWREIQRSAMRRIERGRQDRKLNQVQMLKRAGIGETAYREYVKLESSPTVEKLWKIADVLGLSLELDIVTGAVSDPSVTTLRTVGGGTMTDEAAKAMALLNQIEDDTARKKVWAALREYAETMGFHEPDAGEDRPRRVRPK